MSGRTDDALELLSPESIAFWSSSGKRFGEDFPPELDGFRTVVAEWRSRGMSELEIACAFARMLKLARDEQLGRIERVTLKDGSGIIFERDPRRRLPLIGRRRFELTVSRLAAGLCVIAVGAALVFALTDVLDAWMPNVATSALTIAVTITVVDRLVGREEERRLRPRVRRSLNELGRFFRDFGIHVYMDWIRRHPNEPLTDRTMLLERWLAEEEDIPLERRRFIVARGVDFASQAEGVADADREVLPPDLVAAVDDLAANIYSAGHLDELLSQHERSGTPPGPIAVGLVVSAASTFARTFRQYGEETWFRIP